MKLIDADALLAEILHDIETSGCVNHERDMLDSIRYAPTIDAEPVVRCKDCINFESKYAERFCDHFCTTVSPMDYCSYGRKKED